MHERAHNLRMNTLKRIRVEIFSLNQVEFARVAGVSQSTVSRWESGEIAPGLSSLRRLRKAALEAGAPWDDSLILEPAHSAEAA